MYFFPFSLSTFRNSCNFFANSVDPDQTPRSAASELGPPTVCQCPFYMYGMRSY